MEFDVFIEIPRGTRNKYEMDHETGRLRLDRMLFTATRYPSDYGFIEGTLGGDGDPLDALVLLDEATFPGLPDPVPDHRHVPDDRREGPGREGALHPGRRHPPRAHPRHPPRARSSSGWRSSTSSRSTRTSSPASRSRVPTGWAAPRPRPRSSPAASGSSVTRRSGQRRPRRQSRAEAVSARSAWNGRQHQSAAPDDGR